MARYERTVQQLQDWIAAGNDLPPFLAGTIKDFLAAHGVDAEVTVSRDGTVKIETEATGQELLDAFDDFTPADIDPEQAEQEANTGIMAQLDAFADAVEAGTPPTALQTQQALARVIRVLQYVAARR
jgi:predicted dehydrogenase